MHYCFCYSLYDCIQLRKWKGTKNSKHTDRCHSLLISFLPFPCYIVAKLVIHFLLYLQMQYFTTSLKKENPVSTDSLTSCRGMDQSIQTSCRILERLPSFIKHHDWTRVEKLLLIKYLYVLSEDTSGQPSFLVRSFQVLNSVCPSHSLFRYCQVPWH